MTGLRKRRSACRTLAALAWVVLAGDLNSDKRTTSRCARFNQTYLLYQQKDGKLGSPESLFNTSQRLTLGRSRTSTATAAKICATSRTTRRNKRSPRVCKVRMGGSVRSCGSR